MNIDPYRLLKASVVLLTSLCLVNNRLSAGGFKERFLTEGVARLRELEKLTFGLQANIQEEEASRECYFQGPWLLDIVKPKGDWEKVHPTRKARIPVEVVRGINSRYEFRISRPKDGPFTVNAFEGVGEGPSDVGPYTLPYARSLSASWILDVHPLHEWLKRDGFSVGSVEPTVSSGGKALVKVKAKYAAPGGEKKTLRDPDGSFAAEVLLDPETHWCIGSVSYIYHNVKGPKGTYTLPKRVSIQYGLRIDAMPVPRLVTEVREFPPESGLPRAVTHKSVITDVQKTGTAREDQFMLSRFGLPELNLEQPAPGRIGYFIIALSVAIALAAVTLGMIAKRKRDRGLNT